MVMLAGIIVGVVFVLFVGVDVVAHVWDMGGRVAALFLIRMKKRKGKP